MEEGSLDGASVVVGGTRGCSSTKSRHESGARGITIDCLGATVQP